MPEELTPAKRQFTVPKACKSCKARKIRCDRITPCSNCRMAGLACQKAEDAPEKRLKSVQNNHLEEHVNNLESRLRAIEAQLNNHNCPSPHRVPRRDTVTPETYSRVVSVSDTPMALYEGESSFITQSVGARETAKSMANSNDSVSVSNLNPAFDSLRGLLQPVSRIDHVAESHSAHTAEIRLPLPADLVVAMLRRFQEQRPLFVSSYPINDMTLLERLCQKVYFPTRDISTGDVAAMHGVLYWLMKEYLSRNDDFAKRFDLATHFKSCKSSFEAGIKSHNIITVPSFENVIALTMGILKAQDDSNPLLACHFVSSAARHCQMLGYHRESTYKSDNDDDANSKRRLFWTIYVFDKTMSLLLGRASYIQDFDMDVKTPISSPDPTIRPWDDAFYWMIKLSEVQGNTYNNLYSATAPKSISKRSENIHTLKLAIEECEKAREKIDYSKVNNPEIFELSSKTWKVLHYSVLTTILRAKSSTNGGQIGSECFEAARMCLRSHLECFPGYRDSDIFTTADHANWVQLYSSFTPFIVVFLHSIAATSIEDVKLLEDVVKTLHTTRGVSSASERLYSIGANFASVARGLVEARKSCVGDYDEERDILQLLDDPQGGHLLSVDTQPSDLSTEMMNYLTYPDAQSISAILESWDHGQPSAMDLFGESFGWID